MNDRPTPANYWDSQERIGQVSLSERDALVVSLVRHGAAHYVRLQVHRHTLVDGVPQSVPGQKGVILPIDTAADVAELLIQAAERRPANPYQAREIVPDEDDEPFA